MTSTQPGFKRPFISLMFDCCRVYNRLYLTKDESAFQGRCPKCLKQVTMPISEEGSTRRLFTVH